jgi:hypothetical protein
MRTIRWPSLLLVPLAIVVFGCGGGTSTDLPDCESYVTAYRACSSRQGLPSELVESRAMAMREELRARVKDDASREQTRASCVQSRQRLEGACR